MNESHAHCKCMNLGGRCSKRHYADCDICKPNGNQLAKIEKIRSNLQNNSLHEYFDQTADYCNEHGISVPMLLNSFEVDMTGHIIKTIFQKIGETKFGKKKTSTWTTKELQLAWEEFNRQISSNLEEPFSIPFPAQQSFIDLSDKRYM